MESKDETIARLTAERDTARAETAMAVADAYEDAARVLDAYEEYDSQLCCDGHMCGCQGSTVHQMMQHFIRSLTPAHATAALAARDKATREQALREAADLVESFALGGDRYEYGHDDASMRVAIRCVILEAI